jgi:predicted secreted protein
MPDIGHGTTLGILAGSVYTNIGKITNIGGPSYSADALDATAMDSTDKFKEYIKGLKDWGEFTFSTIADIDSAADTTNYYSSIVAALDEDDADTFKITFPNSVSIVFDGFVTGFNITANTGEIISSDVTIKVTGDVTWSDS